MSMCCYGGNRIILEMEEILTLVVNAQHIKDVPGRKTDVKDSEWIAECFVTVYLTVALFLSVINANLSACTLSEKYSDLIPGCTDVKAMADKAHRQMRKKIPQIEEALHGFMGEYQIS